MTKIAIVYYSATGANYQLAQWAKAGVEEAGAEVRLVKAPELAPQEAIDSNPAWKENAEATKDIPEATADDILWADGIIFSAPTRFGSPASQMKQFIDTLGGLWANGDTVDKVVSAMSSAQNPHGGQEATILSLYTQMFHHGMIVAAPGYSADEIFAAGGNPYGASATVDGEGNIQDADKLELAVKHQAKRTVEVTQKIHG